MVHYASYNLHENKHKQIYFTAPFPTTSVEEKKFSFGEENVKFERVLKYLSNNYVIQTVKFIYWKSFRDNIQKHVDSGNYLFSYR